MERDGRSWRAFSDPRSTIYNRIMPPLTPALRRSLRSRAHSLDPVVSIGHAGLTPAVIREIDVALKAHELVKVRVHSDDRDEREAHLAAICEALDAAPVQHLGKLLIVWRPAPKKEEPAARSRPSARKKPGARRPDDRPDARRRTEPKVGERARKHRRGSSRHERGPTPIDAPRGRAVEPTVPTTSASRGRRYSGGKPKVSPRAKSGMPVEPGRAKSRSAPETREPKSSAPADVRRRRRPTGGRG
jgi:putative YhbY family RNA-binding protein